MEINILKSGLAIAIAIIMGSIIERFKPEYLFEIHGDQIGFTVKVNKTNGQRCLLKEGAVRVVNNWEEMAKNYPVPLNICNE